MINVTYKEYYGEQRDGGASWICVQCCNGFQCVSDPNEIIRSAKGFLCGDCQKQYARNKKGFKVFSREMKKNAEMAKIQFYITKYPETVEKALLKLKAG